MSPQDREPPGSDQAEPPLPPEDALLVEAFYRPLTATEQATLQSAAEGQAAPSPLAVLAGLAQLKAEQQFEAGRASARQAFAQGLGSAPVKRPSPWRRWHLALGQFMQQHSLATGSLLALQTLALALLLGSPSAPLSPPADQGLLRGSAPACAPWLVRWRGEVTQGELNRALLQSGWQVLSGPDSSGRYGLQAGGDLPAVQSTLRELAQQVEANPACPGSPAGPDKEKP